MVKTKVVEIAKRLNEAGVPPEFGAEASRLLIKVMRELPKGSPVTNEQAHQIAAGIGMSRDEAEEFLRRVTERDSDDDIIGIVGLSLNEDWAHRFQVNGISLRTWCAWDTLFIPLILDQSAVVESESPVSKKTVRVTVSPDGVKETSPETAVVSVVALDGPVGSVEEAWSMFCHQVYFFESRQEAEEWAVGRDNMEILTVDEAFEMGRLAWADVLEYA